MSGLQPDRSRAFPIDRFIHANQGRMTGGISPSSAMMAYLDWAVHLANSPSKQAEIVQQAFSKAVRLGAYMHCLATGKDEGPCIEPLEQDQRFRAPEWQEPPYLVWYQAFLLSQAWWHNATVGIGGVAGHNEDVVYFMARQFLDMFSPSNFPATNPEVLKKTVEDGGMNFVRGVQNYFEDWQREVLGKPPVGAESFTVGRDVAVTPGKVVYRNRLIELIQYSPATETVHPEPILIVPAWIMKYYILDLSPENSMVKYLVEQGYTVFMISWKDPTEEDRNLGMEDYLERGVLRALDAVRAIVPERKIHAVGYCIGGTLLSIAAALLGHNGDDGLETVTLMAAQTDFSEAGELMLFIDEDQVSYLEDLMWDQGFLDPRQMAGTFQLLRSNDLIWSRMIRDYLMGERAPMNDLMAWNADATRMPYRMHSEYLRRLFLGNDLAEGRYTVGDTLTALTDIKAPMFAIGAEKDHVAPWKSVYKIVLLSDADVTFLLTRGGHNAGIISEPGHRGRYFRAATKHEGAPYVPPDEWFAMTEVQEGSWWPAWCAGLDERSGEPTAPPPMGRAEAGFPTLGDAPGTYVHGT